MVTFPESGVETYIWLPPLVAFCVSLFTSTAGVSGAFILLPFQMSVLGYTQPSVSATNHVFNITAIPSGVYRYIKEGRMVWPLAWIVIVGTLPGVFIGAIIRVSYLPDPRNFKLFAGCVLLYIGLRMLKSLLGTTNASAAEARFQELVRAHRQKKETSETEFPAIRVTSFTMQRMSYEFYGEQFSVFTPGILLISFVVGIFGGIYGIGGGAIIAPIFVSFFHLPIYTIAGAALMGTCVTSGAGVVFFHVLSYFYADISVAPDWSLGLLFGLGGMLGMYLGARLQKYIPAKVIKWLLSLIVLFVAGKYVIGFFF
ncbi:MAG: sulfite exporter TauE/SafE family protein [Proteobacteria bacterium]|nr:sulfite exporter TauE/SafE family protein [Pseudomonadota bacterium]